MRPCWRIFWWENRSSWIVPEVKISPMGNNSDLNRLRREISAFIAHILLRGEGHLWGFPPENVKKFSGSG